MTNDVKDQLAQRIAWLLLAAAPLAMAAVTWHVGREPVPQHVIANRFFAPPVLLAELGVILLSLWRRFMAPGPGVGLPSAVVGAVTSLLVLAGATSMLVAPDPFMAAIRFGMLALHCAFAIALGALVARARIWRHAGTVLAIGGAAYAAALVTYVATVDWSIHDWRRLGLGVVNVRHTGFYLAAGLGAAVAGAAMSDSRWRYVWLAGAIAVATVLAWSGSRGGYVALVAGSTLTGLALGGRAWRCAGFAIVALAGGAALSLPFAVPDAAYGIVRMSSSVALDTPDAVSSGRLQMWANTMGQIGERPVFGHGEAQFLATPAGLDMYHHPHQAILQLLHQWGAAGLVLSVVLAAWLWPTMRRAARVEGQLLPLFLIANILIVYAFYDGIFFFVYPAMLLTGLCGALVGAGVARAAADRYLPDDERGRPDLPQRTP